jgi:hypothetical protein
MIHAVGERFDVAQAVDESVCRYREEATFYASSSSTSFRRTSTFNSLYFGDFNFSLPAIVKACDKLFAHFSAKISAWLCQYHEHRSRPYGTLHPSPGCSDPECLIAEIPEKEKKAPAGHGPGMGGEMGDY